MYTHTPFNYSPIRCHPSHVVYRICLFPAVDKNEGREEHPMAESHLDSSAGSTNFSCNATAESGNTTAENH